MAALLTGAVDPVAYRITAVDPAAYRITAVVWMDPAAYRITAVVWLLRGASLTPPWLMLAM